jgi:hypothetical protein
MLVFPLLLPRNAVVSRVISTTERTWAQQRLSASAATHRRERRSCRERLFLSSLAAVTLGTGGRCMAGCPPEGGK